MSPHLYVYWAPSLGVWVAQCEQLYTRPWTYASDRGEGWAGALHQGLAHLYMHPRAKDGTPRISESIHSKGDELTSTNGRIGNFAPGRYVCSSTACSYAWTYDGKGTWTGPYPPGSSGEYARPMTGWEIMEGYGDCARSVLTRGAR